MPSASHSRESGNPEKLHGKTIAPIY